MLGSIDRHSTDNSMFNLVNPREFESLFQPWKGCVLTVRRWVHGAFRETRTPNLLITNQLHYQLCYEGEIFDNCPNSRRCRWLPTQEYALRNLTQKFFLNSKSNREGRSTHTVIIPYKSQQVNFKNSLQISNLKKIAVFGAGGKIHRHLGISNPTSRRWGRRESRREII